MLLLIAWLDSYHLYSEQGSSSTDVWIHVDVLSTIFTAELKLGMEGWNGINEINCIFVGFSLVPETGINIFSQMEQTVQPLKRQTKIAAADILIFYLLLSFEENKAWFFMWILCLAEDSL